MEFEIGELGGNINKYVWNGGGLTGMEATELAGIEPYGKFVSVNRKHYYLDQYLVKDKDILLIMKQDHADGLCPHIRYHSRLGKVWRWLLSPFFKSYPVIIKEPRGTEVIGCCKKCYDEKLRNNPNAHKAYPTCSNKTEVKL